MTDNWKYNEKNMKIFGIYISTLLNQAKNMQKLEDTVLRARTEKSENKEFYEAIYFFLMEKSLFVLKEDFFDLDDLSFFDYFPRINEFSQVSVTESKILIDTFEILKQILIINRTDDFQSYEILDCQENLSIDENYEKNKIKDNLKKHLLDLVPKKVWIFPEELDPSLDGKTIYSKTLFINDKHLKFLKIPCSEEEIKIFQALLIVTILHEISHLKRILYFSNNHYYRYTPEKYGKYNLNCEAGAFVEEDLFGGRVDLEIVNLTICKMILTPKNYEIPKFLQDFECFDKIESISGGSGNKRKKTKKKMKRKSHRMQLEKSDTAELLALINKIQKRIKLNC